MLGTKSEDNVIRVHALCGKGVGRGNALAIIARGYLSRAREYARREFHLRLRAQRNEHEFTAVLHLPWSSQIKLDLMLFRFSCKIVKRAANNRSTTNGTCCRFHELFYERDSAIFAISIYEE